MRLPSRFFLIAVVALFSAACATTKAPKSGRVDMNEPRRLVGTENGIRVDAQINGEQLTPGASIGITYDVTNERPGPVAIADLSPESSYDPETQTVTVAFGSEIPGYSFLPRLVLIPSGQKKTFSGRAVISPSIATDASATRREPRGLQVKVHFLGDPKPFEQLIGIPERVVRDPQLAEALLPKWLEKNETILTNVLPMHWVMPFTPNEESAPAVRRRP